MAGQCGARGDEWEEKARKAKNKIAGQCDARGYVWEEKEKKANMARQCEHHQNTFNQRHGMGRQRPSQMVKCYRGCRQESDTTLDGTR